MKARFLALAALVLGLASCQKDFDAANVGAGGEVDFQLSVAAPELATRAGLDGVTPDGQADLNSAYGAIDYLQGGTAGDDLRRDWSDVNLRYTLEVYDVDENGNLVGEAPYAPVKDRQVIIVDEYQPVTFELRLVPKRHYRFVVFADFVAQGATDDANIETQRNLGLHHVIGNTLADIKVKNDGINDECTDAYFGYENFTITNSASNDIVLKRPYGKLRVIATDLHELNLNVNPKKVKVEYTATHLTNFDAVTGAATLDKQNTEVEFDSTYNDVYKEADKGGLQNHFYTTGYDALEGHKYTNANGAVRHTHMTLFTDYILANNEVSPVHFTMTVYDRENKEIKSTTFNTDIPVQRNYLTTVIGNVLTTATEVEVRIDDNFAGEYEETLWDGKYKEPAYDAATKTYTIYEESELAWLAAAVNGTLTRASEPQTFEGKTFKLAADIDLDLNGDRWTPIGATGKFLGTFDGQGNTIYNLLVSETGKASAGLFANGRVIKNLYVENAEVYGHYKTGVIIGDGLCAQIENCHVKNAKIVVTPINNDDANNVGGIVGYLSAEPTAYVKNCSVENAEITAYRKVAGIVGAANGASVVTGNTVKNVTITADQTAEYKEFKAAEAGAIVGYKHANAKLDKNTEGENVVVIRKVDSNEELKAAMGVVKEGDVVEVSAGTYSKFVAPAAKITVNCENGTKFIGRNKLNIKGSTVEGATFTCDWENGDYVAVDQTINGIFKNCLFVSWDALRYCYAGEACVFEDCYFKGGQYGVHFDGGDNDIIFRRCHLSGFNAFAGKVTELTFDECTFYYATDGMWDPSHNGVNLWGKTNLINTTFVFDGKASSEWIGLNGATEAGDEISFTGCKVVDGENNELPMFNYFANYDDGVKVTIDGVKYTVGNGSIKDAEGNYHVTSAAAIKEAVKVENATVYVYPDTENGVYDIESKLSLAKGVRLIGVGEEPVKITNTWSSNLFANQAHFTDTYMENICADNNLVIDAAIANGNVVFKKCIFGGNLAHQGVHFDSGNGTITFDECTLIGRNMLGSSIEKVTFNKCYFENKRSSLTGADKWTGVNMWGKYEFNECTFGTEAHCSVKCDGVVAAFNSCSFDDNRDITSVVNYDGEFNADITFDGNKYVAEGLLEDAEGNKIASSEAGLKDALKNGDNVILANPFTIDQSESNGYGKTGINMNNGGTLDGNGNVLGAPGSTGTWDSAINTSGGTIKNIKVTKGFRGIFIKKDNNHNEKLYLDNVTIDGTTYTISCDSGNGLGLEATNSTFKGWTSYAETLGNAKFVDCYFGYGNGYSFCRPYAPTEFVGCEFEAGLRIDNRANVTFENCTLDGVALTQENIEELVYNSAKATVK